MQLYYLVFSLVLITSPLLAQSDLVYRRGMTIGVELGIETEPFLYFQTFKPNVMTNGMVTDDFDTFSDVLTFATRDTFRRYFSELESWRARPPQYSPRYNVQFQLEKKLLSGLEFGGGLFISGGSFSTELTEVGAERTAFLYVAQDVDYLRVGGAGALKFHLFKRSRIQPFIGPQALILLDRTRRRNVRYVYTTTDWTAPAADSFIGPELVLDVDLRLLLGVDFAVSERIILSFNGSFLGTTSQYFGLQIKYRVTNY